MDTSYPRGEDDLSAIERRLADWQPTTDNLHPDAMLFAAGRAAGRRRRTALLWPAACLLLAVQAVGLGIWGLREHAACQALASRLTQNAPATVRPAATAGAQGPDSSYRPAPGDYLSMRHALERDGGAWLSPPTAVGPVALAAPPPRSLIWTPRSPEGLVSP